MTRTERQELESSHRKQTKKRVFGRGVGLISNIIFFCLMAIMAALVFFLVQSRLTGEPPSVAGYRLYTVLSGSMSPSFGPGSLVAVRPCDSAALREGDVITFQNANGTIITHRIVGIEGQDGLRFVTKGDANSIQDSAPVPQERVIGSVALAIPWLGWMLTFTQTKQGLLLMVIIPSLVVMVLEGRSLWLYAQQWDRAQEEKLDRDLQRINGVMEGSNDQEGEGIPLNDGSLPVSYSKLISSR